MRSRGSSDLAKSRSYNRSPRASLSHCPGYSTIPGEFVLLSCESPQRLAAGQRVPTSQRANRLNALPLDPILAPILDYC